MCHTEKGRECIGKGLRYLRSHIKHKILGDNKSNYTCGSIESIGHQNTVQIVILGMLYFTVVKTLGHIILYRLH